MQGIEKKKPKWYNRHSKRVWFGVKYETDDIEIEIANPHRAEPVLLANVSTVNDLVDHVKTYRKTGKPVPVDPLPSIETTVIRIRINRGPPDLVEELLHTLTDNILTDPEFHFAIGDTNPTAVTVMCPQLWKHLDRSSKWYKQTFHADKYATYGRVQMASDVANFTLW
jgi:hypothetical protein